MSFVLWDSLWSERGRRERGREQNALRKLFCAALTTLSVVKKKKREEEEEHHELWRRAAFSLFRGRVRREKREGG